MGMAGMRTGAIGLSANPFAADSRSDLMLTACISLDGTCLFERTRTGSSLQKLLHTSKPDMMSWVSKKL